MSDGRIPTYHGLDSGLEFLPWIVLLSKEFKILMKIFDMKVSIYLENESQQIMNWRKLISTTNIQLPWWLSR